MKNKLKKCESFKLSNSKSIQAGNPFEGCGCDCNGFTDSCAASLEQSMEGLKRNTANLLFHLVNFIISSPSEFKVYNLERYN